MFRFENEIYLYGLIFIALFFLLFLFMRFSRRRKLNALGDQPLIARLMPETSKYKPAVKFVILSLAFAFIVIGIANPQIGTKMEEVKRKGIEIIVALDVSNSMRAEDIKPNRLERAKQSVIKLINSLTSDKFGLVVFAGDAYLQLPLTTDYSAAKLMVSTIETDMIPLQGTALGKAIELSTDSFSDNEKIKKSIIVISDGENHEDDALAAANEAEEKDIVIHTIGMGSIDGAPIPVYKNGQQAGYIKDGEGNTVVSRLDAEMLRQVADQANGRFIRSGSTDPDLPKLLEDIEKLEKTEFGSKVFTDYEDRFQYLLAAAVLLLVFELFLSDKSNKYLRSLNLFAEGKK